MDAANALLPQYQAATDSSAADSLHSEIELGLSIANGLGIGKWVGAIGGSLLSLWGINEGIATNPRNSFERYIVVFFKASIDSRKRFAEGVSKRPGDSVLLSPMMDALLDVNTAKGATMPVFVDLRATPEIMVSSGRSWIPSGVALPPFRPRLLVFLNAWDYPSWGIPLNGVGKEPGWVEDNKERATSSRNEAQPIAATTFKAPLFQFIVGGLVAQGNPFNAAVKNKDIGNFQSGLDYGAHAGAFIRLHPSLYIGPELDITIKSSGETG